MQVDRFFCELRGADMRCRGTGYAAKANSEDTRLTRARSEAGDRRHGGHQPVARSACFSRASAARCHRSVQLVGRDDVGRARGQRCEAVGGHGRRAGRHEVRRRRGQMAGHGGLSEPDGTGRGELDGHTGARRVEKQDEQRSERARLVISLRVARISPRWPCIYPSVPRMRPMCCALPAARCIWPTAHCPRPTAYGARACGGA